MVYEVYLFSSIRLPVQVKQSGREQISRRAFQVLESFSIEFVGGLPGQHLSLRSFSRLQPESAEFEAAQSDCWFVADERGELQAGLIILLGGGEVPLLQLYVTQHV